MGYNAAQPTSGKALEVETVVLACNTIRDELEKAATETNCPHGFVWVESGLHLVTDSLRRRLQTDRYLRHFLSGPWNDDSFVMIPPFTTIELKHLGLDSTVRPSSIQAVM